MFNNYGPLATEVYNLTKPIATSLNGDLEYYAERLKNTPGKILEVGVGTGRLFLPLLAQGLQMEGIDLSSEMLSLCQQHLNERGLKASLYQGDISEFSFPTLYEAIIIPTATFNLFPTEEVALASLRNIYQHLQPNGRLILDLDLPFYPELGEITTTTHPISEDSGITLEQKTVEIDWLAQHTVTYLKYEKWEKGQLIRTELQKLLLRWYGLSEFHLFLKEIGFRDIIVSADYQFGVLPLDSNQTISFEATK